MARSYNIFDCGISWNAGRLRKKPFEAFSGLSIRTL